MSVDSSWRPTLTFDLPEVIEGGELGGVRIGTVANQIMPLLGPPEAPTACVGRKSTIWVALYGNVSFLLDEWRVCAIDIDFHGNRTELVHAGEMGTWRRPEWEEFARRRTWTMGPFADMLKLKTAGFAVSLNPDGVLHFVQIG